MPSPHLSKVSFNMVWHKDHPPMPVRQFRKRVLAITHNSTDEKVDNFREAIRKRHPEFVYLGSRDEIDYGIYTDNDLEEQEDDLSYQPEFQPGRSCLCYGLYALPQWPEDAKGTLTDEPDPGPDGFGGYYDDPRTFTETIDSIPQEETIERLLEIGTLMTWTDEEKWSATRFSVVKSVSDGTFWIISKIQFEWEDYPHVTTQDYFHPHQRAFPLDGFTSPIAFARLKGIDE
ncbi:MAG: hypothetical protein M1820_007390 [Bogoriella megaspora]|nr:MAG: hypothetical protein M1820_007390 [Bogoriella megaspora]